jgi:ATP-binding cassette subfamily D (ALD) long-chain fatty acid import protein
MQELTSSMTEDFVIKYFWSAIGYGLMSIPIFYPAIGGAVLPGSGSEHDQVAARAEGQLAMDDTGHILIIRLRLQ